MEHRIKQIQGKDYIFCAWRRRFVRLTPEEWVRQNFLHRLVENFFYPHELIGVEVPIKVGDVQKRCDAIVYTRSMQPWMLIECKADTVTLTQQTLDQAAVYNRKLNVPYLVLHNGKSTIVAQVNDSRLTFLQSLPSYLEE